MILTAIDYCEMEFTTKVLIKKDDVDYKVIPLANKIADISGNYLEVSYSEFDIKPNYYIEDFGNKYIIDYISGNYVSYQINNQPELTLGMYNVYDEDDQLLGELEVIRTNSLYIDEVSDSSIVYVEDELENVYEIGTVNCDNGFTILDNMTDTIINDASLFVIHLILDDDISFNVKRELFLCPEVAEIQYI